MNAILKMPVDMEWRLLFAFRKYPLLKERMLGM